MQRVLNTAKQRRLNRLLVLYWRYTRDNASVNSNSAQTSPPPPLGRPPGIRNFLENKLANAPPPGQNSCSNAPGWWLKHVKNVLFSSFLVLLSVESKLIQTKISHSWVLFPVVSAKIGHSTALASHCMSYLDAFNTKLTVFADEFVIKKATML